MSGRETELQGLLDIFRWQNVWQGIKMSARRLNVCRTILSATPKIISIITDIHQFPIISFLDSDSSTRNIVLEQEKNQDWLYAAGYMISSQVSALFFVSCV